VCLAVDFAHTRGVVHRDLKPANVMLGDFGEVYVLDWGIAKVVDRKDTPEGQTLEIPLSDDAVTRAGKVLGTPQYMAPERKKHGVADRRTDIFALGVMLSEILAAHADPPPELTAIVARATAREPDERFATARELQELLEKYLDGDRDLELRRVQSEEHAQLAEQALARTDDAARTDAGHEIGRALGLDPTNARALRTLMRLLTEVPAKLPPAAQAEVDRVWRIRRTRTLQIGTLLTMSPLLYVPFVLWMGVRDWTLFGLWIASSVGAGVSQLVAARNQAMLPLIVALACAVFGLFLMTTSMGLTGLVPAAFAIVAMAWRLTVRRVIEGVFILVILLATLCTPFVLDWLGIRAGDYAIEHDTLVLLPQMHHFPAPASWAALVLGTMGAVTAALLFGRIFSNEIQRVERNLTFNAWQLQQLVPPSA
jgi:eukaryotic-like serine/threonine-protein kinase